MLPAFVHTLDSFDGLLVLKLQLTLGYPGHYCPIDSVTSTDPLDPYRKLFIPVSVLFYLYHLFYATTEHYVYKSYSSC